MIWSLGYVSSYIKQEDPEWEEDHHPDLDLLARGAEEDGEQQHRGHNAGQDDIHDVERVSSESQKLMTVMPLMWTFLLN